MDNIVLSIVIPTYKRPEYLIQAIDSAVNQDNTSIGYEIIVINNDSNADMSKLISKYENCSTNIRFYVNERNLGMIGNVNRGYSYAKGKYVAFLHDDDILLPNYVSILQDYLDGDKICIIPQRYLLFDSKNITKQEKKKKIKEKLSFLFRCENCRNKTLTEIHIEDNVFSWLNCYCAPTCGVVFLKSALYKYNLFFPEDTLAWDFLSFLRLNKYESIFILRERIAAYRMTVGLTLKASTQIDFYKSFMHLLEEGKKNDCCISFIQKYENEIKYLTYSSLSKEAQSIIDNQYHYDKRYNKIKYYIFMFKRIMYFYQNRLEVEKCLDSEGRKILKKMGVLE